MSAGLGCTSCSCHRPITGRPETGAPTYMFDCFSDPDTVSEATKSIDTISQEAQSLSMKWMLSGMSPKPW
jgi:hypothetical protein